MSEAEDYNKKAIEWDKNNCMMWNLGKDYTLYSELFKRKGNKPKGKKNVTKAIEILKECGADAWLGKCEKDLAALT